MGSPIPDQLSHALDLARTVAEDPTGFLTYIGILETEHQRLTQATDILTARNVELKSIIERAGASYSETRSHGEKGFTDCLVKKIAELNDENEELRNLQEINKLLKLQNKNLLDGQEFQTKALLNQANNIDKDYKRLTQAMYEYGVNGARLRSERDILQKTLEVTRKHGETEKAILKAEYEAKISKLNKAEKIGEELEKKAAKVKAEGVRVDSKAKTNRCSEEGCDETVLQTSSTDPSESLQDDKEWFLKLDQENERLHKMLKENMDITSRLFKDLAASEAQNEILRYEISMLATKFNQISADSLSTFNTLFEKAMSIAWHNFGKLQLTLDEQIVKDAPDAETAMRIVEFSGRVATFGQLPLTKMEQDVRALVESTCAHFREFQEELNAFGQETKDSVKLPQTKKYHDELGALLEDRKEGEESHNPVYIECLASKKIHSKDAIAEGGSKSPISTYTECLIDPEESTLIDRTTDDDEEDDDDETSPIGALLASIQDIPSEFWKTDSVRTKDSPTTNKPVCETKSAPVSAQVIEPVRTKDSPKTNKPACETKSAPVSAQVIEPVRTKDHPKTNKPGCETKSAPVSAQVTEPTAKAAAPKTNELIGNAEELHARAVSAEMHVFEQIFPWYSASSARETWPQSTKPAANDASPLPVPVAIETMERFAWGACTHAKKRKPN